MRIFLWIVGSLIGLFVLLWMNVVRGRIARNRQLDEMIRHTLAAVDENREDSRELVIDSAKYPATRNHLFARLKERGKAELFPAEYRTLERIAESDLARWLMHPNELRSPPDQIELISHLDVVDGDKRGQCFLFRYRVGSLHWAAHHGWMVGMAGPFWEGDPEPDAGRCTFSDVAPYGGTTAAEHVEFLKDAIRRWQLAEAS